MKVKFECTLDGIRLAKDGEYKITFVAPLVELSNALSVVRGLNRRFQTAMIIEGNKSKFDDVALYRMSIDKDGETKVVLSVPYEGLGHTEAAYFGRSQQKNIIVYCKINGESEEEAEIHYDPNE